MLNTLADSRDINFVLFELLKVQELSQYEKFSDFDQETFEAALELAERVAVEVFQPTAEEGDKEGCKWDPETKAVAIPECYGPALDAYYESGFMGIGDSADIGGMGMPHVISAAAGEYVSASNYPLMMYPGLTHGAMELITEFGSDEQKATYVDKMINGQWGGTMCLTEAEAGSDVGNIKTKAIRKNDDTFLISGQKIFISNGDSDYYENIIHAVLARIDGDPAGTKGLSLFLVPKYDLSSGSNNDVVCTGIEHKMGIKGSATASLSFGDEGTCTGYLLGEERKGIKHMFQMMNFARMGTALAAQANASTAYMHAVAYAKARYQGAHITQMLNPDAPMVSIIQHPDVKRMLLWMKSHVEGQRALINFMYHSIDISILKDDDEAKRANALVELLTPICKAGCSDMGLLITSEAVQVYGGYGYCSDYPVEKFMRDSKILTLWEGTNGIQSMDLTMRKILMNKDQYNYSVMKERVHQLLKDSKGVVEDSHIDLVKRGIDELDNVIEILKEQMATGKFLHIFMNTTPFQQAMYMFTMAWMHLWSLSITIPKMKELVGDARGEDRAKLLSENKEAAFYSGKVLASQFYISSEFPKYFGRMDAIKQGDTSIIKASDDIFTGAPDE